MALMDTSFLTKGVDSNCTMTHTIDSLALLLWGLHIHCCLMSRKLTCLETKQESGPI